MPAVFKNSLLKSVSLSKTPSSTASAAAVSLSRRRRHRRRHRGRHRLGTAVGTRNAGNRIVRAARLALEEGALLDGDGLVVDIAFDMARGLQQHAAAANGAEHMAADDALLGNDAAGDAGLLADHDVRAVNVALDLALDLDLAFRHEVAVDYEIGTDDRGGGRTTRPERLCRLAYA